MTGISLDSIQFYRPPVKTKSFHHEEPTTLPTRGSAGQAENSPQITGSGSVDHQQPTSFTTEIAIDQGARSLGTTGSNAGRPWSEYPDDFVDRASSTMGERLESSSELALDFRDIEIDAHGVYDKFCGAAYQAHNLSDGEHNLSYIEGYALDDVGSSDIAPAALIFEQTWSSLIQKPADHEGATNVLPVNDDNTDQSTVLQDDNDVGYSSDGSTGERQSGEQDIVTYPGSVMEAVSPPNHVHHAASPAQQMCKHTKSTSFRGDYRSDVCEDTHVEAIDMDSGDELGVGVTEDNQSRLQSRKKRSFPANEQKPTLRRGAKRHRFSSPFSSSNEGTDTEDESDVSNYTFFKRHRPLKSHLASTRLTDIGVHINDSTDTELGGHTRQPSSCRTAVVYEQQRWEGEIIAERDGPGRGRGRRRKQYLIRWQTSWVEAARLTAPALTRDWKEKMRCNAADESALRCMTGLSY